MSDLESSNAQTEARVVVRDTLEKLSETQTSNPKFFPNGIELIHLKVEVSPVTVELKVAGKEAPASKSREEERYAETQ